MISRTGVYLLIHFVQLTLIVFIFSCMPSVAKTDKPEPQLVRLFDLPKEVTETSGIVIYDSLIWTFNDSGNDPILFGLDLETGDIKKRIYLQNAVNTDWEDITQDKRSIFIADVGNNSGNREDLTIYILSKDSIRPDKMQEIYTEKIVFSYSDQTDYTPVPDMTTFDCEALCSYHDSLYLLTKDWMNATTTLYRLPKKPGKYEAVKVKEIDCDGLITGAEWNESTNELYITGFKQYVPFILIMGGIKTGSPESKETERIDLFDEFGLQIEGICFYGDSLYLTNEKSVKDQALYLLKDN